MQQQKSNIMFMSKISTLNAPICVEVAYIAPNDPKIYGCMVAGCPVDKSNQNGAQIPDTNVGLN